MRVAPCVSIRYHWATTGDLLQALTFTESQCFIDRLQFESLCKPYLFIYLFINSFIFAAIVNGFFVLLLLLEQQPKQQQH